MSVHAIDNAERTRDSNELRERPLSPALRRAELLGGSAFLLIAGGLALFAGVESFSLLTALVYVVGIAIASNVRFDFGAGFTVPTQAVFVPMLFAVPVAIVPLLTLLALVLGMVPAVARGRIAPSWMLTAAGNCWFAIGPALVLVLAGDQSPDSRFGILALALAAQFTFDFVAAMVRNRLFEDDLDLGHLVREVAPIYAIDVALSSLGLAVALAVVQGYGAWPVILIAPLFLVLRVFSKERQERLEKLAELNDAYQGTALLLGDVVEADDSYTGEHSKSVVRLALDVAAELGLDPAQTRNVEFGALLHDVGKIAIPNEIINKPGRLNEREWEIVKTHTIEGQKMLERIGGFMTEIGTVVRASHEAWDGSGYPDGLRGEEIPIEARVVSACDAFNAMTTTRSYRRAMPLGDAIAEMEACAGSHFDPRVVEALLRVIRADQESVDHEAPAAPVHVEPPQLETDWGAARNGDLVKALAELAVGVGANVRPGQHVEVSGETGHLEVVRAIAAAAYARGAEFVDVEISDPLVQAARIEAAPQGSLSHVPEWERERVRDLTERGGASILVTGPTCPGLLDRLDPRRVALASRGPSAEWRNANRAINWTIVPAATEGWAADLRPQLPIDDAVAALWADIAHVCRLDAPDPIAAWKERLEALRERAVWLTAQELRAVRFEGPGTDLTIGLMEGVRWERAEMVTPGGIGFVPNLPTEEVYTTPDSARVDGHVRLTRPVVIGGRRIEGVSLRFLAGRVVEIDGPPEVAALREFVARDDGTARLGELALVDADSRVAQLGQTFGEILLDENAASHIALGYGFPSLIPSSSRQTANASDHHLDLMIGSPEVQVTGVDRAGNQIPLLRDGTWVGTGPTLVRA
ncbi:MAG TPA: aminopeptidase [Solirubrobacterales bacterium]|nr:aminopeptidase [Solirubrobacterales bacterium]